MEHHIHEVMNSHIISNFLACMVAGLFQRTSIRPWQILNFPATLSSHNVTTRWGYSDPRVVVLFLSQTHVLLNSRMKHFVSLLKRGSQLQRSSSFIYLFIYLFICLFIYFNLLFLSLKECIYHGLRNLPWVLCDTLSQCFISGASVYILRCLHLYSFESYDRLFTL